MHFNLVLWSPFWKHISQAWKNRASDNLLFVFFSDMKEVPGPIITDMDTVQ